MFASKPLASLSSGLLARKGQARPAMRPQPISFGMASNEDDLGWNDMGEPEAEVPPVLVEREALAREVAAPAEPQPEPEPEPTPEPTKLRISDATAARLARESAALTTSRKAAFTLRLPTERHLRLRLASALAGRSAQQLVTEALDAFLSNQPDLDAIVAGLPNSNRQGSSR